MPVSKLENRASALSKRVSRFTTSKLKFVNLDLVNMARNIHVNAIIAFVCRSISIIPSAGWFILSTHCAKMMEILSRTDKRCSSDLSWTSVNKNCRLTLRRNKDDQNCASSLNGSSPYLYRDENALIGQCKNGAKETLTRNNDS